MTEPQEVAIYNLSSPAERTALPFHYCRPPGTLCGCPCELSPKTLRRSKPQSPLLRHWATKHRYDTGELWLKPVPRSLLCKFSWSAPCCLCVYYTGTVENGNHPRIVDRTGGLFLLSQLLAHIKVQAFLKRRLGEGQALLLDHFTIDLSHPGHGDLILGGNLRKGQRTIQYVLLDIKNKVGHSAHIFLSNYNGWIMADPQEMATINFSIPSPWSVIPQSDTSRFWGGRYRMHQQSIRRAGNVKQQCTL